MTIREAKGDAGVTYLSSQDKAGMVENRSIFTVEDIDFEPEGQFGPRWVLNIVFEEDHFLLTFADSAVRARMFTTLRKEVPFEAVLVKVKTKAGRYCYDLQDPVDELVF